MSYFKQPHRSRGALSGLGDYSDSDQCSTIPLGSPYRKPGNYCATPDDGITTFNADGSTYRAPGAVDPDPAHPAGSSSTSGGGGFLDTILKVLGPRPAVPMPTVLPSQGMSTTTTIAVVGGAALLGILLLRR